VNKMALETPIFNLEYKRGDSRAIIFELVNKATGEALDLTSWNTPVLAVNSDKNPTDETGQKFKVSGSVDDVNGWIIFSPTTTDSDQTPAGYYYDAQVIDNNGGKFTFVKGKFKIVQDIAKD
jgi:hypothetical protein